MNDIRAKYSGEMNKKKEENNFKSQQLMATRKRRESFSV